MTVAVLRGKHHDDGAQITANVVTAVCPRHYAFFMVLPAPPAESPEPD